MLLFRLLASPSCSAPCAFNPLRRSRSVRSVGSLETPSSLPGRLRLYSPPSLCGHKNGSNYPSSFVWRFNRYLLASLNGKLRPTSPSFYGSREVLLPGGPWHCPSLDCLSGIKGCFTVVGESFVQKRTSGLRPVPRGCGPMWSLGRNLTGKIWTW